MSLVVRTSSQDWKVLDILMCSLEVATWIHKNGWFTRVAVMQRWNSSRHSPLVPLGHEMSIRTFLSARMNEEAVDSYGADSSAGRSDTEQARD